MPFVAMVYVSTARGKLSTAQLDSILEQSRRNNERAGITGMLLYADGSFIQAIEGPQDAIESLVERLRRDPRHADVIVIARYTVERRQFPDWSMGFRRMEAPPAEEIARAFADLRDPLFDEAAAAGSSIAHRLLEGFRRLNIA